MMGMTNLPPKPGHLEAHCEGDVVVARIRGPYDTDVARYLESLYVAQATQYGYRLALFHARETTTITPEARRLMSEWNAARRDLAAGAVVGASFAAKTIAGMLTRAIALLTRAPAQLNFFDTEMEARSWLDVQRIRFDELRRA
jgi:hypothetical protein